MKTSIQADSGVDAVLNGTEKVTIYHLNGKVVTVDRADLDFWLNEGYRLSKADPTATAKELKALFPEALDAVLRFVKGVTEDGTIDTNDEAAQATAQLAMRRLEETWGQLVRDIEAIYPVTQGTATRMLMPDGAPRDVDPSQVDLYLGQGWSLA